MRVILWGTNRAPPADRNPLATRPDIEVPPRGQELRSPPTPPPRSPPDPARTVRRPRAPSRRPPGSAPSSPTPRRRAPARRPSSPPSARRPASAWPTATRGTCRCATRGRSARFVRDWVDSGWHAGELLMPLMLVVILLSLVPNTAIVYYGFVGLWLFIMFVVVDMIFTSIRVKKLARAEVRRAHREGPRLVRRDAHHSDALHAPAQAAGQARPAPRLSARSPVAVAAASVAASLAAGIMRGAARSTDAQRAYPPLQQQRATDDGSAGDRDAVSRARRASPRLI